MKSNATAKAKNVRPRPQVVEQEKPKVPERKPDALELLLGVDRYFDSFTNEADMILDFVQDAARGIARILEFESWLANGERGPSNDNLEYITNGLARISLQLADEIDVVRKSMEELAQRPEQKYPDLTISHKAVIAEIDGALKRAQARGIGVSA